MASQSANQKPRTAAGDRSSKRPAAKDAAEGFEQLDEKAAMLFWSVLLGAGASFVGALVAAALHIDVTMIEAAFFGAFMGSTPLILLPNLARLCVGRSSTFGDRRHWAFRLFSLGFVLVIALVRLWAPWPNRSGVPAFADAGLFAALLATWFGPHFPRALRLWSQSQWPIAGRHAYRQQRRGAPQR